MRTVGESNLKKALWFLGAVVIALLVMTWLEPFLQGYEIKTAGKILCSDMIRANLEAKLLAASGEPPKFGDKEVRTRFLDKTKYAGVKFDAGDFDLDCGDYLDKDRPHCFSYQYSFDAQTAQHVCTIHVRYRTDTPPALVGQVLQELPHLKLQHHIDAVHRISKNF